MGKSSQVNSLWVGDLHLCERTYSGREQQQGDPQFAWDQVVAKAKELKAASPSFSHVLLAGDVFNSKHPDPATVALFRRGCNEMKKVEIKIEVIQGNHDLRVLPWAKAISPSVGHLHTRTIELGPGKISVAGLDYQPDEVIDLTLAAMDRADILLCHQRWAEFSYAGAALSLRQVPWTCQVFSGDTHKYARVKDVGNVSLAISPGATYMRKSDEPERHYVFGLTNDGEWETYRLQSRPVLRVELLTDDEVSAFLDNLDETFGEIELGAADLPKELRTPLVVVKPGKLTAKARHRVTAGLRGIAHLFWSIGSGDEDESVVQETAQGGATAFLEAAHEHFKKKPISFGMLKRLWQAGNLREELIQMRKEQFGNAD
jgi:hypothetical protein